MKMNEIRQKIRDGIKEDNLKKECQKFVIEAFEPIRHLVRNANQTTKLYETSPSIKNGSEMGRARAELKLAIEERTIYAWDIYFQSYHNQIDKDEYAEIIKDTINKVVVEKK